MRLSPVLHGSSGVAFASSIRLQYADDFFRKYKSPEGAPVEFRIPEGTSIAVAYFRLVIQDYSVAPCLRMEMMGCSRSECLDLDECAVKNGDCQQKCVNNPGGFACSCGYDLFVENGMAGFHTLESETGVRCTSGGTWNASAPECQPPLWPEH